MPDVNVNINNKKDAFGLLETSTPHIDFDAQLTYDEQPLVYEQVPGTGTITYDSINGVLNISNNSVASAPYIQTYRYFPYLPGIGKKVYITFNFKGNAVDNTLYAQYGDATNAIGLRLKADGLLYAYIESTTGLGSQESAGIDPATLGETGMDINAEQIMIIEFEALYVGTVKINLQLDNKIVLVHQFDNANNTAVPYIRTANLPVRVGLVSTGTTSTDMIFNCCSVQNMGGNGFVTGYDVVTPVAAVTAGNGTPTHAVSVRPKTIFKGRENRVDYQQWYLNISVLGNSPIRWQLVIGQALTAPTYSDINATYSSQEYVIGATLSGTPGVVIAADTIPSGGQFKGSQFKQIPFKYPITLDAAGANRDLGTLTLLVEGVGGTSAIEAYIGNTEIR